MVYKCCVPMCRGNYGDGPKVMLFSFPKDANLCRKWVSAIHRDKFQPTQYTKVCELHFTESDICRYTECYDEVNGKKLTVKLSRPRLKGGAVPSVLPACPSYLSAPSTSSRESAEERRTRLDNEHLQKAISDSVTTEKAYDSKKKFSTFDAFLQCLERESIPNEWTVVRRSDCVIFLLLTISPAPSVSVSAVVTKELQMSVYRSDTEIRRIDGNKIPDQLFNINDLFTLLDELKELVTVKENSLKIQCLLIQDILSEMCASIDEENQKHVKFISEQVKLLCCTEENYRFSAHFSVFCCILHSISPHAYKFFRSSGNLILPHPRTLQKMCSSYSNRSFILFIIRTMFLYIKERFKSLHDTDCTVSLMMDEIHIKPYFDYTGGSIVGAAFDSDKAATTAYVFMIQSLLSSFKEVVHVLPVRSFAAEQLFFFLKKILCGLHEIGFRVVCVVSDNNAINRKAVSLLTSPPKLSIVYPHPANTTQPLFYIIDSVHILKCIRNNWVNQKDSEVLLKYPLFDRSSDDSQLSTASFEALRQLHKIECNGLLKHSYGLTLKSLYPSSLEKQSVSLVLQVFSEYVTEALSTIGEQNNIMYYQSTAEFIKIILSWFKILNVKTIHKGVRLNDPLQSPLSFSTDDEKLVFLEKFLGWLERWKELGLKNHTLSKDTHLAVMHTTHGLIEMARYCTEDLGFTYFLPGKIQTDSLEARFSSYRSMAGSHYHISMRQIFEVEAKIRMQNFLPLVLNSSTFGKLPVAEGLIFNCSDDAIRKVQTDSETVQTDSEFMDNIVYMEEDFKQAEPYLPIITYLAGYCVRTVLKKQPCEVCSKYLLLDKEMCLQTDPHCSLIKNLDRGGLFLPQPNVVTVVVYSYITVQKLVSAPNEKKFLSSTNQRTLAVNIAINAVQKKKFFLTDFVCNNGHLVDTILKFLIKASTNALLNNYIKKKNDTFTASFKKRKLSTF